MNGMVDQSQRALIVVLVGATKDVEKQSISVWIDTAFNGGLVIPRHDIEKVGLKKASTTQAILADGKTVDLETYTCYLEWFGNVHRTQVVANQGEFPLLGTILLADRQLVIDYRAKTVTVD